ncbi:hypothetical protein [Trichormus azollae]|uniref:hypothetical protein n=1 Tax=Trichormus azollae TaxID=1164 RepID=UPI00325C783D
MENDLLGKLDIEILKQLATEQLVEIIIEEGEIIEKLKVSRDLVRIRLWKALLGSILKKTENKQQENQEENQIPKRKLGGQAGIGEKRERSLVE